MAPSVAVTALGLRSVLAFMLVEVLVLGSTSLEAEGVESICTAWPNSTLGNGGGESEHRSVLLATTADRQSYPFLILVDRTLVVRVRTYDRDILICVRF